MNKTELVAQLVGQLESAARAALAGRDGAALEAREGATPDEKREDARAAHQLASIGRGQERRAKQAIAEIEDADTHEGRTFFLAPVGGGVTLTGPGGDGHLSVVTPISPIGRAVL